MTIKKTEWLQEIRVNHLYSPALLERAKNAWLKSDKLNIVENRSGQGLGLAFELLGDRANHALFVHIGDVRNSDDLLLCLSEALPGPTWGQGMQTQSQLRQFTGTIVLYGADKSILKGLEMMTTFKAKHQWLLISDQSLGLSQSDTIECSNTTAMDTDSLTLSDTAKAFAYIPAGLPSGNRLPRESKLSWYNERETMRWDFAQAIREMTSPSDSVNHIATVLNDTLRSAESGIMPMQEPVSTLFALRWISEASSIQEQSLKATISYARLRTVLGQPERALTALEAARNRDPDMPPRLNVMLHWSSAQAHAQTGDLRLMRRTSEKALEAAVTAKDDFAEIMILRTRAETQRLWGDYDGAAKNYQAAMKRVEETGVIDSKSAILRGFAELAIVDKQFFKAVSLLEQAKSICNSTIEAINRQLTIAGLRLESGHIESAENALDEIEEKSNPWPILRANLNRRRAELAMAKQDENRALQFANDALKSYQNAGQRRESSATLRLKGDIVSLLGDRQEALEIYRKCLTDQAAIGDGNGLQKTLTHLLMILKPGKHKEELKTIAKRFQQFDFGDLTHSDINWPS